MDFIQLIEPTVVEDEQDSLSLADKLRRVETYEPHYSRVGKVRREKLEAFEAHNAETFDPEESP